MRQGELREQRHLRKGRLRWRHRKFYHFDGKFSQWRGPVHSPQCSITTVQWWHLLEECSLLTDITADQRYPKEGKTGCFINKSCLVINARKDDNTHLFGLLQCNPNSISLLDALACWQRHHHLVWLVFDGEQNLPTIQDQLVTKVSVPGPRDKDYHSNHLINPTMFP